MSPLCYILLVVVFVANTSYALIGDGCSRACTEQNASCQDNVCTCISGYVPSNNNQKCLHVVTGLGTGCEEDLQCTRFTELSTCEALKCKCLPEATLIENTCQKKRILGEICSASNQCTHILNSLCAEGVCKCQPQFVPKADSKMCLPLAALPDSDCEESIQCSEVFGNGGTCANNKCACVDGKHYNGTRNDISGINQCVLDKGIGDSCANMGECFLPKDGKDQNIKCDNMMCKCKDEKLESIDKQSCNNASMFGIISMGWLLVVAVAINISK